MQECLAFTPLTPTLGGGVCHLPFLFITAKAGTTIFCLRWRRAQEQKRGEREREETNEIVISIFVTGDLPLQLLLETKTFTFQLWKMKING